MEKLIGHLVALLFDFTVLPAIGVVPAWADTAKIAHTTWVDYWWRPARGPAISS
jgi:hypothetical protein